jgi:folate-binding protein YgfZ
MSLPEGFSIGPLTVLELTGADRNKILNNLCTQDLRSLQSGQSKESFMLDVKGRTISHGSVACLDSLTLWISSPGQAHRLVPHIDRYIIREDAMVRDVSEVFLPYLLRPESPWMQTHLAELLETKECSEVFDNQAISIQIPWLGPGTLLVLATLGTQSPQIAQLSSVCHASQTPNLQKHDGSAWETLRIKNFWPWYGVDIDERNLPQEIGIDARAISFNKGCYLGQETVARLDALGQVQKKLALVELRTDSGWKFSGPTELMLSGKSIGTVTSASPSDTIENGSGLWIGLAMLRRGYMEPGSQFATDDGVVVNVRNTMHQ